MKLLFLYTPFSYPVSPPIGIAYLKGFVNKYLPKTEIKCFDLNLNWYSSRLGNKKIKTIDREKFNKIFKFSEKEKNINKKLSQYLENKIKSKNVLEILGDDIKKIKQFNPDVVGFSLLIKSQLIYSLALAKLIKEENKKIKIVFGGGVLQINTFKVFDELVCDKNVIDCVIRGQGEYPLLTFLKELEESKSTKSGLKTKKKYKRGAWQDSFPDYSDFDLKKYFSPKPVLPIHIARGCSWGRCVFCSSSLYPPVFKPKKINKIIKEVKFLKEKFNISSFYFIAPETPAFFLKKLSGALIKNKLNIYYSVYSRPTADINRKLLEDMYESGCRLINYGVESFSQRILNLMKKGTRVEDIVELLKRTKKAKIKSYCWYIVGFPTQTEKEIQKEIKILKENSVNIDFLDSHEFFLKKNSLIYKNKKLFSSKKIKKQLLFKVGKIKIFDDEKFDFTVKSGISQKQAKKWLKKIWEEFISTKNNNKNFYLTSNFRESYILSNIKK